jgi:hypothetical protein
MGAHVFDTLNGEYVQWGNDPELLRKIHELKGKHDSIFAIPREFDAEVVNVSRQPPNHQVWPAVDIIGTDNPYFRPWFLSDYIGGEE